MEEIGNHLNEGEDGRKYQTKKNITLADRNCPFVVSEENEDEMVIRTPYGKCGAVIHQTGFLHISFIFK